MTANTDPRSIWTDTVLDLLLDSLRRDRPDAEIRYYLKQLRAKGLRAGQVLQAVREVLGEAAANRVARHTRSR